MPAYVISEVEIVDEALADAYRSLAAASIAQYGGRYVVRGGAIDVVEGDWPPARRVVIVEFSTIARARQWYASAEYAEALQIRHTALNRRLIFVEGVPAPQAGPRPVVDGA
jgi:uncharacterized protein (DUF1330 family)